MIAALYVAKGGPKERFCKCGCAEPLPKSKHMCEACRLEREPKPQERHCACKVGGSALLAALAKHTPVWACAECGTGVKACEDGTCAHCGNDVFSVECCFYSNAGVHACCRGGDFVCCAACARRM